MTVAPAVPWWKLESLPWNMAGPSTLLPNATDPSFNDAAIDVGGAKLVVQNSDPAVDAFEAEHRVVRYSVLDLAASAAAEALRYKYLFAAVMDRPNSVVIAPGEEKAEVTTLTGRAIIAQWEYSRLDPPPGNGEELCTDRYWNFAHHSIDVYSGNWTAAVQRALQGNSDVGPPDGLNGGPWNFSNPLARWLSSRVSAGADPDGVYLLAFDYTPDHDVQAIFDGTADDAMQVWVNERPLGDVWDYPDGDAAGDTYRGTMFLPGGETARIRVAVANFPRPGSTDNCGLFVLSVTEPVALPPFGIYSEDTLFTTSSAGWRSLDYVYCAPAPGPSVGYALVEPFDEAQNRGENTWWSRSFTETTDSAGNPWPTFDGLVGFTQPVGTSYVKLLDALVDAGWIEWDVTLDEDGLPVLHAWSPLGGGTSVPNGFVKGSEAGDGNLTALEFDIDHSDTLDGLVVEYDFGTFRVGAGPKTDFVKVRAATRDEAVEKANAILAKADTLTAVTGETTWIDQELGPYWGQNKLDTVTAVARNGEVVESRIVAFNVSADKDTGRPIYKPQLIARRHAVARRQQLALARMGLGSFGGRTAAAIPTTTRTRPMQAIGMIQLNWSVPGDAAELESGLVPPEQLMRLNRLLITSTEGSGTTRVRLLQAGTPLVTANIGTGTPVEQLSTGFVAILRPEQRVQVIIGADGVLGAHQNLQIVGWGGYLGLKPLTPVVRR